MNETPEPSLVGKTLDAWQSNDAAPPLADFIESIRGGAPRDRADAVLIDQRFRRERGEAVRAEEYFARCPDLAGDPELRLDIVYGEFRGAGDDPDSRVALEQRFPDLREALVRQSEVSTWLDSDDPPVDVPDDGEETLLGPPVADDEQYDAAPLLFADYQLQERLGRGAMGEVYRAVQRSLGKAVAVKFLRRRHDLSDEVLERFLREARATASLRHPNIVGVHGIGRCEDQHGGYFLVMDLIDGRSLHEEAGNGVLAPAEAAGAVADAAAALHHAHTRGIVHRDVKPANLLRDAEGRVVVVDFGLAKLLTPTDQQLSMEGAMLGTPQFMAPEQIDPARGEVGPAADVYGLGATLYKLLTGDAPFAGGTTLETMNRVLSDQPAEPPSRRRGDVPPELEAICLDCLAKDPAGRPGSADEVEQRLRRLLSGPAETIDYRTPSAGSPAARSALSNRRAAVAVGCAAIVLAGWAVWSSDPRSTADNTTAPGVPTTAPPVADDAPLADVRLRWRGELFPPGETDTPVPLIGPVVSGDRIRLYARLSESCFAYVYWLGSDGRVEWVEGAGSSNTPVDEIRLPGRAGHAAPIEGPPGVEACVVVLRREPLDDPGARAAELAPATPLPPLDQGLLLADGSPLSPEPPSGDGQSLAVLEGGGRGLGDAEPLMAGSAGGAIAAWVASWPEEIGSVHYLAIPHLPE